MLWSELPKNLTFCMLGKISPPRVMYGLHTLGPVGNQQPQYPPILRDQGRAAGDENQPCPVQIENCITLRGAAPEVKHIPSHPLLVWTWIQTFTLTEISSACFIALLFWEKLQWICIPFTNSVGKSTLDQFVELSVGEDSCQSSKLGWTPREQQS